MATTQTPSAEESRTFLINIMKAIAGIIMAIAGLLWSYRDTPSNRAANEAAYLANQGKELDLELAKENRKLAKITSGNGSIFSGSPSTQPGRPTYVLGSEGQYVLSAGRSFVFNGTGEDTPSAMIAFFEPPVAKSGAFKVYGMGKTAWTESWSSEPSPYPLDQLMSDIKSGERIRYAWIYVRGKAVLDF
jgi:hypothetical protein